MNKRVVAALALGGFLLGAAPGKARMATIYENGGWTVESGTYSDDRAAGCKMNLAGSDRSFMVHYVAKTSLLIVQLLKQGWHVPPGTRAMVSVQVDRAQPIFANAIAGSDPRTIEFTVSGDLVETFTNELSSGVHFQVSFPNGSEPDWVGDLAGSTAALHVFWRCVAQIMPETTQPYSAQAPTQPQGSQPQTPQPAPRPTQPQGSRVIARTEITLL